MTQPYKLSKTAHAGILEIAEYTDQKHGHTQTEAYLAGLEHSFILLAQFPDIAVSAFEIKEGWRRYTYQSHYIFYTQQDGFILIEAIVHTSRNLRAELFQ